MVLDVVVIVDNDRAFCELAYAILASKLSFDNFVDAGPLLGFSGAVRELHKAKKIKDLTFDS